MDAPDGRAAIDDEPFASELNVNVPELVNVPPERLSTAVGPSVNAPDEAIEEAAPLPRLNVPGPFIPVPADEFTAMPLVAVKVAPEAIVNVGAALGARLPNITSATVVLELKVG